MGAKRDMERGKDERKRERKKKISQGGMRADWEGNDITVEEGSGAG